MNNCTKDKLEYDLQDQSHRFVYFTLFYLFIFIRPFKTFPPGLPTSQDNR